MLAAVRFEPHTWATLLATVQQVWPAEAVLALGGTAEPFAVRAVRPLPNTAPGHDRFAVPAAAFAAAEHHLRQAGHHWLGFAHSHPTASTQLSALDHQQLWRGCLQVVVAGPTPGQWAAAAYFGTAAGFRELPLELPTARELETLR
jgi:proteasome lid subunit RPN8/RPN11